MNWEVVLTLALTVTALAFAVMSVSYVRRVLTAIKCISIFTLKSLYEYFITNSLYLRRKCRSSARLDGKVVVITGGNTGIGKETALQLSLRGAQIVIGCRDLAKGENAITQIKEKNQLADIKLLKLDLSSFSSIRQFAKEVVDMFPAIDILINNAGVMMCPEGQTEDGFELQFGTNYLGHFLLIHLLMDSLKRSPKSRIINVSSICHILGTINFDNLNLKNAYKPLRAYAQSKLAIVLMVKELAKRLGRESTVTVYCLHPGVVRTEISRHFPLWFYYLIKYFMTTTELGTQTTLHCALDTQLDKESGFYYDDCRRVDRMISQARDERSADRLYRMTCQLVQLEDHLALGNGCSVYKV